MVVNHLNSTQEYANMSKMKLPPGADKELEEAYADQKAAFRSKFGRDRLPGEPLFFDPDSDVPTFIDPARVLREVGEALSEAGLQPDILHAVARTGFIPSDESFSNLAPDDQAEFRDAVAEYHALHSAQ